MTLSKPDSFRDHLEISYDHISKNSIQNQDVQFPEINSRPLILVRSKVPLWRAFDLHSPKD